MFQLPRIYEMTPDEWQNQVLIKANQLEDQIVESMGRCTSAQALYDMVGPQLGGYMEAPGDDTVPQLRASVDGEVFYMGTTSSSLEGLTYRDAAHGGQSFWWYDGAEYDSGEQSPETIHRWIVSDIMAQISWCNEEAVAFKKQSYALALDVGATYVEKIEKVQTTQSSADLRAPFVDFMSAIVTAANRDLDLSLSLKDASPDTAHTHLHVINNDVAIGHILAVAPGTPLSWQALYDIFEIPEPENLKVMITDHIKFDWSMLPARQLKEKPSNPADMPAYRQSLHEVVGNNSMFLEHLWSMAVHS